MEETMTIDAKTHNGSASNNGAMKYIVSSTSNADTTYDTYMQKQTSSL